jgi:hypothetical protein
MPPEFNVASPSSSARKVVRATSSVRRAVLVNSPASSRVRAHRAEHRVSSPAVLVPNTSLALALCPQAEPALLALVPASAHALVLARLVRAALELTAEQRRLPVRRRARLVLPVLPEAAAVSSIRRPKKAR